MDGYSLRIRISAAAELDELPRDERQTVVLALQRIAEDPAPELAQPVTSSRYRLVLPWHELLYDVDSRRGVVTVIAVRSLQRVTGA